MATTKDYLENAKWIKRIDEFFHQLDVTKDGYISEEDYLIPIDNIAKVVTDRPEMITKVRKAMLEFTKAIGITGSMKVGKPKYRELIAGMAVAEVARLKRGEKTLLDIYIDALFDVVDKNHDGYLTWDEYKVMMVAANFGEDAAKATFALMDQDKNEKIDRKEFHRANFNFWFGLDDSESQGLFGDRFE